MLKKMVQYSVWPTCCNDCKFCLRLNRDVWNKQQMIDRIRSIRENISYVDWKNEFPNGISLLGGELYFITDKEIQDEFLSLIDDIIEKILLVSTDPNVSFSTVTNGLYNPEFLFKVLDRIAERAGVDKLDINFSYDIKYRFASEEKRLLCIDNINKVHNRYNYKVGVQTIVTQYLIDAIMNKEFDIDEFQNNIVPGCELHLLYPHPLNPLLDPLPDFQFKRNDLIKFAIYLKNNYPVQWYNFYWSTYHSGIFKYTGMIIVEGGNKQAPILADGKEILNEECGHSKLYQCYTDSNNCLLCDLQRIGE